MASVESLREHFKKCIQDRRLLVGQTGAEAQATIARIKHELATIDLSDDCEQFVKKCENELFQWLSDSGDLDGDIKNQPVGQDNLHVLQRCVDKFSSLLSQTGIQVSHPPVRLYHDPRFCAVTGHTNCLVTTYDFDLEYIKINDTKHRLDAQWPNAVSNDYCDEANEEPVSLHDAMLTVCHEMRHFFNMSLCRDYANCNLNEGDRFFHDGMYFREMVRYHSEAGPGWNGYIDTAESAELNKLQLDERCAYGTGGRMKDKIAAYLDREIPDFARTIHPATFPVKEKTRVPVMA